MAKTTKSRKKKKSSFVDKHKRVLLIVAVVLVAMAAVSLPFVLTKASADTIIYIPKGTTMEALTDSLKKNTDDTFASRVTTLLKVSGMKVEYRHGAFKIEPSELKFTFNNVRTLDEFATRAGNKFEPSKKDFLKALADPEVCAKLDHTPDNIGCILLADSYKFYWDITPEKLLKNMYNYYVQFWNDERTQKAKKLGLTPDEVVIVASIAEEETSKSDERGKVGRLYINRLQKKMRLQADPTDQVQSACPKRRPSTKFSTASRTTTFSCAQRATFRGITILPPTLARTTPTHNAIKPNSTNVTSNNHKTSLLWLTKMI